MLKEREMGVVGLAVMFLIFAWVNLSFGAPGGSDFVVEYEDESGISVADGLIGLKFFNAQSGFGLYSLSSIQTGYDFLAGNARQESLWKMKFRNAHNQFLTVDNTVKCNRTYKTERSPDGSSVTLHLFWKGIAVGDRANALDVQASIRLDKSGLSYWRIDVTNRSSQYGAWEVTYPAIRGLKAAKEDNMQLAHPCFLGQLLKNPVERMSILMRYPSHTAKMQFSTLFETENKSGLYLAAHDSRAYVKKFLYELDEKDKSIKYEIKNYPDGMGRSGNNYEVPYEVVVGVYTGDWITASKIYRNWAVKQKWCSKGKLFERDDIPQWLLDTSIWFKSDTVSSIGGPKEDMITIQKYLDVPMAIQWYNWHEIPFDVNYPDYFPPKEGFSEKIDQLHSAGIKIVPYINGRLWDTNSKSWKKEKPQSSVCKGPYNFLDELTYCDWGERWKDLAMYMEHWAGRNHAAMCPYTRRWQDKIAYVVNRLACEYNVDGVYIDQIASYMPVLCFDPGHGHSLGGGIYWVEGYRKLIALAKERAREEKPATILTTEGHAEPFLDLFDGHLTCNSSHIVDELIPMFHYVYSGYCITYGRYIGSKASFVMGNAQMFVWGDQLGWFPPDIVKLPSLEVEYLKKLGKARYGPARKFLLYGEMVRPPELEGDNPVLSCKWGGKQVEMPAIIHSAWKAEDGTLGLVFTNMDTSAHTVSYTVDAERYQLPKANMYSAKVIAGENVTTTNTYDSCSFARTEKMPARSVLVLEIKTHRD